MNGHLRLNDQDQASLGELFERVISVTIRKMDLGKNCITCANFNLTTEICAPCGKRPPASVIVEGCSQYQNIIPF